jgi:hypothetical protein
MSTLEVNSIAPVSGSSDVTIGGSSKNIKFASGTTVDFNTNTPTLTLGSTMKMTPAFRAQISGNKTLSDASNTKIAFDSEDFDTDNCYDASSNYRFTPTVAGKYLIGTQIRMLSDNNSLLATTNVMIFKNGSEHVNSPTNFRNNQINGQSYHLSDIITFNGSSDYVEIYVNADVDSGGIIAAAGNTCTFFGYRIIGA